jgi:hypothetical protein
MTSAYYTHSRLRLIHGLPAISGDTNTNESVKKTVDLLSAGGFNLATDFGAWVPRLGALAGGGNYLQLGGAQGEVLQESNYERVTETFTLTVNTGNPLDRLRLENDLLYMKHNAEAFWAQEGNLDPVYIEWGVVGQTGIASAPIYQYAHVYSLDFAWSNAVPQTVTLTVVRRPDWWPIPPGSTPQRWTKYALSQSLTTSNSQIDVSAGVNNHRAYGYVHMNTTWSVSSFIYTGYIDIPASSIPGNLPALATIAARMDTAIGLNSPDVMMVSRYTKPTTLRSGGTDYAPLHTLEAVQMTLGTDATSVAETNSISGNAVSVSFATATLARRLEVNAARMASNRCTLVPGKYVVFARVEPQAITSTFSLQLRLRSPGGSGEYYAIGDLATVSAWDGVSIFEWNSINLGEFTIPQWSTATDGTGLEPNDVWVELWASRTGGASALRISDLTFMPTDEQAIVAVGAITLDNDTSYVIDGSYYGTHGYPDDIGHNATGGVFGENLALQGNIITLRPGANNRLYFYVYNRGVYQVNSTRTTTTRAAQVTRLEVGVNIIPRWLGLRDT